MLVVGMVFWSDHYIPAYALTLDMSTQYESSPRESAFDSPFDCYHIKYEEVTFFGKHWLKLIVHKRSYFLMVGNIALLFRL